MRIEHIWQMLFRGGFFPAERILSAAISAIDIALWDIKGKALGVPVYDLLGGKVRDKVLLYPHNPDTTTIPRLVESCLKTKAVGWKFVRWGLPQEGPRPRAAAIRAAGRPADAGSSRRRSAMRWRSSSTYTPGSICRTRSPSAGSWSRCAPFHRRTPLRSENRRFVQDATVPHRRAAGGRRAVQLEVGIPAVDRGGMDRLRPHRSVHRRRVHEARKIAGWSETHTIKLATHNPLGPVSTPHVSTPESRHPELWRPGMGHPWRHAARSDPA